ncbi:cell division inhibitor SepF [Clostridium cavendishii DSM 21758]|uniref:Cell division protein SepF n=1 Tax=Clostridium cavendishii DSM 21758 TaxID=1121302 RepID=A0A1M6KNW9_9CLOT|nr:cell division protein SepF [Clostridium cavendishii]SHJ60635.1 cell division inhibitor SepF [Clostridium cavendishii DSM 21758]
MAAKMFNKMKEIFGFEDYEEDYEEYDEEVTGNEVEEEIEPVLSSKRSGKVVNIHTASSAKVMITKPTMYEDATEICDSLRNRKIVVVNTTALENRIAQRLLDFISGSCYALSGELQEIEKGVYILSPSNVEVTNELKNELSSKGLFNWSK